MSKLKSLLFSMTQQERVIPVLKKFLAKKEHDEATIPGARVKYTQADAKMSVDCFTERIEEFNHDDPATKHYYHPSSIGQCQRKLAYRHYGAPTNGATAPQDLVKSHLIFEIGTYAHVMVQNLLQAAGLLAAREIPLRDDKLRIIGHADGKLRFAPKDEHLLEIKTINARGYSKLYEPKQEHQMQVGVYMGLLDLDATTFLYYDKDSAELKEFTYPFDRRRWENELKPRILRFHESIESRKLPAREGSDPKKFPCAWCEYSSVCFDTLRPWTPDQLGDRGKPSIKLSIKPRLCGERSRDNSNKPDRDASDGSTRPAKLTVGGRTSPIGRLQGLKEATPPVKLLRVTASRRG